MADCKPCRETTRFKIWEYPQPICEIYDKAVDRYTVIDTPEDAKIIRDSLNDFLSCIPREFGGEKSEI